MRRLRLQSLRCVLACSCRTAPLLSRTTPRIPPPSNPPVRPCQTSTQWRTSYKRWTPRSWSSWRRCVAHGRSSPEPRCSVVQQVLSFITAAFESPPYNFPLFLFGTYAQESAEAAQSTQTVSPRRNKQNLYLTDVAYASSPSFSLFPSFTT